MSKTRYYTTRIIMLSSLLFCMTSCDNDNDSTDHGVSTIPIGVKCQIVLRGDIVAGLDRMITDKHTSETMNGSRDSVWGRVHEVNKDWVAVSLADIKVEVDGNKITTLGAAGRLQEYIYYVPRKNIAYIRTFK